MQIKQYIDEILAKEGFISIADFMSASLSHFPSSYYMNSKIIGQKGDFITAPEISQLFGEITALWVIEQWENLKRPAAIRLLELGPGQGLLMHNIIKIAKLLPEFYQAVNIDLLEINPNFIEKQKIILAENEKKITWHQNINDFLYNSDRNGKENTPILVIANEFFDAMPVHQYIKKQGKWEEIGISFSNDNSYIETSRKLQDDNISRSLEEKYNNANDIIEISYKSIDYVKKIGKYIKEKGGAALLIDYGYYLLPKQKAAYTKSTLQAIKNHQYQSSLFENIGNADLSAHVDFFALKEALNKVNISNIEIMNQRDFLLKYGILIRAELLAKGKNISEQDIIQNQLARLIDYDKMGELFKVLIASNF